MADALDTEDRARLAAAREEIARAWSEADYGCAAVRALKRAVPGTETLIIQWDGPAREQLVIASDGADGAPEGAGQTRWVTTNAVLKHRPYDPRERDPLANRVVTCARMRRGNPQVFQLFDEMFLQPLSLGPYLRATLYYRGEFGALINVYRARGDVAPTERDRRVIQGLVSDLAAGFWLRRRLESSAAAPGTVVRIAEALRQPAMVTSPEGVALFANSAAREALARTPAWLDAYARSCGRAPLPRWVRAVPLDLEGQRFSLLLMDASEAEPEEAHETYWAKRWRLSPRHARVAACLLRGMSDKDVARELGLEVNTIRTYVRQLYRRVGVGSRAELVFAVRGQLGSREAEQA